MVETACARKLEYAVVGQPLHGFYRTRPPRPVSSPVDGRQRNFGNAFAAFTTCVGGHYSLDLNRELDREAAIRLSEWSHLDQMCLR